MTDGSNPVRQVQQHLRRAATLLAQRQFAAAIAQIDAALAIDPQSLPAQALRERIVHTQQHRPRPSDTTPATDPTILTPAPAAPAQRFVPTGVNAESWIGFEQRIQERRFNALIDQINAAIAARDGIAARVALEEARELRPDAPVLAQISSRVMLLPVAMQATSSRYVGMRALSAVALLLAGVALLLGGEWIHPAQTAQPSTAIAAPAVAPAATTQAAPTVSAPIAPTVGLPDALPDAVDTRPTQMEPEPPPQPVATAGIRRAVNIEGSALGGPAGGATFRQASTIIEPGFPPRVEEVPDDYVAAQPRRDGEAYAGSAVAAAPPAAIVASAARPPVTIAPPPPPAVSPAVATVAVADETRVAQVLNQYARAYGQLDASAARKVWPTVDERALARAFASLQSQSVSFDDCDVNVSGTSATASCRGRASYVGKVGNREPRTEARQWTFQLRRGDDDGWQIKDAAVR